MVCFGTRNWLAAKEIIGVGEMTTITDATQFLIDQLIIADGEAIDYYRGVTKLEITAVRSKSSYEQQDSSGLIKTFDSIDWQMDAADISSFGLPARGDYIEDANGKKYTVMDVGSNVPCYQFIGAKQMILRVHTKEVSA